MRPPRESRRLCYAPVDACLGTSALALLAAGSAGARATFTAARELGRMVLARFPPSRRVTLRGGPGASGGPLAPAGRGVLAVLGQPARLRVDAGRALAAAVAPRARELAGRAAEV